MIVIAISLPVLNQPFGRDEGIFATIADRILAGGLPFRDAWDHKPPGIDAVYALAFRLFGRSWTSVHLVELIGGVAAMTAIWLTVRRWNGAAAVWAALLFGIGRVAFFEWWDRGQAEISIAVLSTIGIALVAASGRWTALLAGVLLGLVVWFKPTAGSLTAAGALLILLLPDRPVRLASFVAGTAFGALVPLLPFALGGAVGDLWTAVIAFNTLHVQSGANYTIDSTLWATVEFLGRMSFLTPLAVAGLVLSRNRRLTIGAAIWLVAAVAGVWAQGKFFSYHWSVALPPLAVLAGLGLVAIARDLRRSPPVAAAVIALATVIYGPGLIANPVVQRDLPYLVGRISTDAYQAQFGHDIRGTDVYSFLAARQTGDYLRSVTRPGETVLVWGFQPLVNWLADRPPPSRYIFSYPLTIDRPESAFRREARRTFLSDIQRAQPAYVVLVSNDVNPIQPVDSVALIDGFPEFKAWLAERYVPDRDIADFRLYRRK